MATEKGCLGVKFSFGRQIIFLNDNRAQNFFSIFFGVPEFFHDENEDGIRSPFAGKIFSMYFFFNPLFDSVFSTPLTFKGRLKVKKKKIAKQVSEKLANHQEKNF